MFFLMQLSLRDLMAFLVITQLMLLVVFCWEGFKMVEGVDYLYGDDRRGGKREREYL
jgi:hypothetical protein